MESNSLHLKSVLGQTKNSLYRHYDNDDDSDHLNDNSEDALKGHDNDCHRAVLRCCSHTVPGYQLDEDDLDLDDEEEEEDKYHSDDRMERQV